MTIWELKALGEQKIKDEQLTEQQRKAWQNALNGVRDAIKLFDDIFYGRVHMCSQCKRKNKECTNRQCLEECKRMTEKSESDQLTLF